MNRANDSGRIPGNQDVWSDH